MRAVAFRLACLALWFGFLAVYGTELVRAEVVGYRLEVHACQRGKCRDHALDPSTLYVCQGRARTLDELTPPTWTTRSRCVPVAGTPEA